MRYGSVCSGVEAASLAWEPLGWQPAWFSEIEPFPAAVLAQRWLDVPNLGDMTAIAERIRNGEVETPDVLVGGTPCQAFSVAGLRRSLEDDRGNLTLKFVEIANAIDEIRAKQGKAPCIIVWENVPGVLSVRDNAFGCLLGALAGEDCALIPPGQRWTDAGCVHGPARAIAWRVLDAQYFGVAQRRRRVILVASAGNGYPAEILFECDGVRRDTAPRREAGQDLAGTLASRARSGGFPGSDEAMSGYLQPLCINGRQDPLQSAVVHPLASQNNGMDNVLCINANIINKTEHSGGNGLGVADNGISYTLTVSDRHAVQYADAVRRLMPVECERLQGMPDDHTRIPWRGKAAADCPDGPRYKAIGNSMAVPVMRWIGERIQAVGAIKAAGEVAS